jgi:hypothetical protein
MGIISVCFEVTNQLLIRSFAFVRYWRKNGSTIRQYIRQLGGPICRLLDNIIIGHREAGWCGVDWIDLAQDRVQWRALLHNWLFLKKGSAP